jgi:hypothetical protein
LSPRFQSSLISVDNTRVHSLHVASCWQYVLELTSCKLCVFFNKTKKCLLPICNREMMILNHCRGWMEGKSRDMADAPPSADCDGVCTKPKLLRAKPRKTVSMQSLTLVAGRF